MGCAMPTIGTRHRCAVMSVLQLAILAHGVPYMHTREILCDGRAIIWPVRFRIRSRAALLDKLAASRKLLLPLDYISSAGRA